jgi:hypothetical protein
MYQSEQNKMKTDNENRENHLEANAEWECRKWNVFFLKWNTEKIIKSW